MADETPFDWEPIYHVLRSPSTPTEMLTPGTQVSATPADGPTQEPTHSRVSETQQVPAPAEEDDDDDDHDGVTRHSYSAAESEKLLDAWIATSEDPIVGNQQSRRCFWDKVTEAYNRIRPEGSPARKMKQLRCHFWRIDADLKRFCGNYRNEERTYQSGANSADIMKSAMMVYLNDSKKPFKLVNCWEKVRYLDRWAGGTQSSTDSSSRRTKRTSSYYSSGSGAGEDEAASEVPEPGTGGSSSGSRRRPQGVKAAKAARARGGRGQGQAGSSGAVTDRLMALFFAATTADTSRMTPFQLQNHNEGIVLLRAQLGLPPMTSTRRLLPDSRRTRNFLGFQIM